MADLQTINRLIESMSKPEKRYFQLYSNIHGSSKAYQFLFALCQSHPQQPEKIKAEFKKKFPASSFETISNHLFSSILKSLNAFQNKEYGDELFLQGIREINQLLKRHLSQEAIKRIHTLRKKAILLEKFNYAIILTKLETEHKLLLHEESFNEEELVKLTVSLNQLIKKEMALNDISALYQTLELRFRKEGPVRSTKEKERLNDLVFSEMNFFGNPRYHSFETQKNHLMFQATYFLMTGQNASAASTFRELSSLFDQHTQLWEKSPEYYILHLRRILDLLYSRQQYTEMPFFIEKLNTMMPNVPWPIVFPHIYIVTMLMHLGLNNIPDALSFYTKNQDITALRFNQIYANDRFLVLLVSAVCLFKAGKVQESANLITPHVSLKYQGTRNQLYLRICRLFNLVVHMELNNKILVASELRSLERELKTRSKLYTTEVAVFRFLKKKLGETDKSKIVSDPKLSHLLIQMRNEPYEIRFLQLFNFANWMESKA